MKIIWKDTLSGSSAMLGQVCVGGTFRVAEGKHRALCNLPYVSIETAFQYQSSKKDAQTIVDLAIDRWVKLAGLK